MLKEAWDSFKDNIKERVSNPFLGTFVLVWVVHNWKIVYAFFYFDKDWKLQQKIDHFNNFWKENNFIGNLFCVALIAIGVLIVTYLFLALSRFLSNYFENVIIPNIQKISKGKIVTAETYQIATDRISLLEEKIEIERKAKNAIIQERDDLEKRIYPKEENVFEQKDENKFKRIIQKALSDFKKIDFDKILLGISKSSGFVKDVAIIDFLIKNGLIELDRKSSVGSSTTYYYKFTLLGNEFKNEYYYMEV